MWTIFLSIITAAVLGQFSFSWTMNRDFGSMQERDRIRTSSEMEWKSDLKEMKIDVNEQKGKMIKLQSDVEDLKNQKTR
ncbi:MAG TPA: hypothetical protein VF610_13505, partial [Segetibacter sp.]|jgi:putative exporter of polyketide antibiotics